MVDVRLRRSSVNIEGHVAGWVFGITVFGIKRPVFEDIYIRNSDASSYEFSKKVTKYSLIFFISIATK